MPVGQERLTPGAITITYGAPIEVHDAREALEAAWHGVAALLPPELGPAEEALHAGLARLDELAGIDRVHVCGPRMRALHAALPAAKRGEWFEDSAAMAQKVAGLLDAGDVCMVKGSLGSAMGRVVEAIRALGRAEELAALEEA